MATRKKGSTKQVAKKKARSTAAKRSKRPPAVTTTTRKSVATARVLTAAQRRKLLAPPERYDELSANLLEAWAADRTLRVPSLTLARLRALSAAAARARIREETFRERMQRQLTALEDVRLQAENDLWRAVLDVNAAVKAHARSDAAILDRFAFLGDAVVPVPPVVSAPVERVYV